MEASVCSMPRCRYHVFLSFRGADTRKSFTDHLYKALVEAGFNTFRDYDEIRRGENIELETLKAIRESKMSILVFSEEYASSTWCLDKLAIIMDHHKLVGHVVLPIFFDVDPSQVRDQTGRFAEAFLEHERFKEEKHRVDGWRAALRQAADLVGGMVLQDGYQSEFIHTIVKEVGSKLSRTALYIAPYLVGIEDTVKHINSWVQDESNDIGIATIYGIGGIGKTTIAMMVYNLNLHNFKATSFLASVREMSEQPNGLVRLQRQLLSDIMKRKANKIHSVDEGITKIKDAICCKRVLLILDDVDQLNQFKAIIGMREWFYPGSKIIITTRNQHLLKDSEVSFTFKVEELGASESLQLFSWHAFGQDHPVDGYEKLSKNVVYHCEGLPLALQVLGASFSGRPVAVWESALQKLQKIADNKIQKILTISYDSLPDAHDKNLFLDIACFFTRMNIDYVVAILDGCEFYTRVGIENLKDRCLINIDEDKKLMMHSLLRDMGREIVRQESPENPGKRSRLWDNKDAFTVLTENKGTASIRGLKLNLPFMMENKHKAHGNSSDGLMQNQLENSKKRQRLSFFSWKQVKNGAMDSFSTNSFAKMQKLKLLNLHYVKLSGGGYGVLPRNLAWLSWRGFPLDSIPIDLCLEGLTVLDMCYSNLKHIWKGIRFLGELKILNLSHSHGLVRSPIFTGLPRLERLLLKDCINLVVVDESIGDLERLVLLNLKDCKSLERIPIGVGMLESLEELIVSGCVNLVEIPERITELKSLRLLHADGTAINQTCSSTRGLKELSLSTWKSTFWSWLRPRRHSRSPGFSLGFLPSSIVKLSLADCRISDNSIPSDLGFLPSLKNLNLSGNPINGLPLSISSLVVLESLVLDRCTTLQSLPELPVSVSLLKTENCISLERIRNLPTGDINSSSISLDLMTYGCQNLTQIDGFFKLEPVGNINAEMLRNLGLFNLEYLENIEVEMFNSLSCTETKTTVQALHESGICSVFLPGSEVPDWFSNQSKSSSISFHVPPAVDREIFRFSLCILYACDDLEEVPGKDNFVTLKNKTNHLEWTYIPTFYGVPKADKKMLWLSHWNLGNHFEAGDEVHILMELTNNYYVKECGIHIIEEQDKRGTESSNEERVRSTSPWYVIQLHDPRRWRQVPSTSQGYTDEESDWDSISDYDEMAEQNSESEDSDM